MSETNKPRVKFNLTNSDQTFETTHASETQRELESLRELRHNSPTTFEVISDSFVKKKKTTKLIQKTPEFSRISSSVVINNLTKFAKTQRKTIRVVFRVSVDDYLNKFEIVSK